jgi:hypothetical protein
LKLRKIDIKNVSVFELKKGIFNMRIGKNPVRICRCNNRFFNWKKGIGKYVKQGFGKNPLRICRCNTGYFRFG